MYLAFTKYQAVWGTLHTVPHLILTTSYEEVYFCIPPFSFLSHFTDEKTEGCLRSYNMVVCDSKVRTCSCVQCVLEMVKHPELLLPRWSPLFTSGKLVSLVGTKGLCWEGLPLCFVTKMGGIEVTQNPYWSRFDENRLGWSADSGLSTHTYNVQHPVVYKMKLTLVLCRAGVRMSWSFTMIRVLSKSLLEWQYQAKVLPVML